MREYFKWIVSDPLRKGKQGLRQLRKCLKHSKEAFRPTKLWYRLAIDQFGDFEIAYREGTADEEVLSHSFEDDIFFSGVPEYHPEPHHVIIDVGAHIGTFSILAASKVPEGKVYAIEASEESFSYLRVNVALNGLDNVEVSHLALAGRKGRAVLHHDKEGNWGHSITRRLSDQGEEVKADTLGNYMAAKGIERCDFMKLNCEGAEFPILMTASTEVLRRFERMLVLYHCNLVEEYTLEDLLDRLQACGFSTQIRNQFQDDQCGWIIAEQEERAKV